MKTTKELIEEYLFDYKDEGNETRSLCYLLELNDAVLEDRSMYSKYFIEFLDFAKVEFIHDNDVDTYDSYGAADNKLSRIFKDEEGNLFEIYGRYQSYAGTEWKGVREVEIVEKVINVYQKK